MIIFNKIKDELSRGPQVSIINLVNHLVEYSYDARASDIHIDPAEKDVKVRLRIDGILVEALVLPKNIHSEIISRIKILSGLRTDEHQAAQDGRFRLVIDNSPLDIRVSIIPTYHGENVVLRLLSDKAQAFTLETLGFTKHNQTKILHALKNKKQSIIDLEALAHHKGSAFGALGQAPQPSQEHFENKLAESLWNSVQEDSIWIEDESQRIGTVIVPTELFKQMRASTCYFLEIPFEERLNFIVEAYGSLELQGLQAATIRIQKRLGGLETKNTLQFLEEKNIKAAFDILLKYYDRWYAKFSQATTQPKLSVQKIGCEKVDAEENAQILIKTIL